MAPCWGQMMTESVAAPKAKNPMRPNIALIKMFEINTVDTTEPKRSGSAIDASIATVRGTARAAAEPPSK